jgi:acyl dehydratase
VERRFSVEQIEKFGDLVQDKNILHSPPSSWEDAVTEMPHLEAVKDSGLIQFSNQQQQNDDGSDASSSSTMIKPVVHGIFVSSLFSSIFGSLSPGCVYMNQTLQFANPVFAEELILGRIEIQKIRRWRRGGVVLQCHTTASVGHDEDNGTFTKDAVTGVANVWLPSGYQ